MRLEQRWGWRRLAAVLAVGLVVILGAAGCGRSSDGGNEVASLGGERRGGGDGAAADGAADEDPQEAALEYARCMREHGIDMPDPGEGGLVVRKEPGKGSGADPESSKFRQAEEACKHLLPKRDGAGAGSGGGS
jgi:hypothetical protein